MNFNERIYEHKNIPITQQKLSRVALLCSKPAVPKIFGCWAKFTFLSVSAGRTTYVH